MLTLFPRVRQAARAPHALRRPGHRLVLECLEDRCLLDAGLGFVQTNLASDIPGLAPHTDHDLLNPWGFSETPDGQFRISANVAGNAPLLTGTGIELGKAPVLPPALGNPPGTTSTPNGNVVNTTTDFVISDDGRSAPASVLFSTEDGTIVGFNPKVDKAEGILAADQSAAGAVYKLLAAGSANGANFLYATNFHNNTIDVFDKNFHLVHLAGSFTDPTVTDAKKGTVAIPSDFAPFGVKNINGILFVTYAKQNAAKHDDVEGVGNGFIDEFDTSGHFLKRFATQGTLNSPIGETVAPAGFGPFGGDLLVGNFGDSHVNIFNLQTGAFLGQLSDAHGQPLTLNGGFGGSGTKGLWGIAFGNGHGEADPHALFFAAGINGENDGLFGKVTVAEQGHDPKHEHSDSRSNDVSQQAATTVGTAGRHTASSPSADLVALLGGHSNGTRQTNSRSTNALQHTAPTFAQPPALPSSGQTTSRGTDVMLAASGHASDVHASDLFFSDFKLDSLG